MPRIEIAAPVTIVFFAVALAATLLDGVVPINPTVAARGWPSLDPNYLMRLVTWPVGHANLTHFMSNFTLLLLLGPLLERRFGSIRVLLFYLITAVVVGVLHGMISDGGLIGASGIVFMAIMLLSLSDARHGSVPLSFLLIALLYAGREVINLFQPDQVSQLAHLAGGAMGVLFGLGARERQPASRRL